MSETPSSTLLSTAQLCGHYAGFVSRTIAFIIDLIIVTFIQIAFVLAISLVFNFLGLSSIIEVLRQTRGRQPYYHLTRSVDYEDRHLIGQHIFPWAVRGNILGSDRPDARPGISGAARDGR
jgi:hypothetical protein